MRLVVDTHDLSSTAAHKSVRLVVVCVVFDVVSEFDVRSLNTSVRFFFFFLYCRLGESDDTRHNVSIQLRYVIQRANKIVLHNDCSPLFVMSWLDVDNRCIASLFAPRVIFLARFAADLFQYMQV
jgi:hypothetical protein